MKLTPFQHEMMRERDEVIKHFQSLYKTGEINKVLEKLEDKDIEFLIYCSSNLHANIMYSKYLKNK